jgi:hypothetical protein
MATRRKYMWLPLREALAHEAEARRLGVSEVARSDRGFMRAYERARGDPDVMATMEVPGVRRVTTWDKRREEFIARHLAQYRRPGGRTRRRWLALAMWAYKPPDRL